MFFDIAWPEFMLIAVVALVVIGPKDLPRAMRVAGFWLRKARTLSREFQSSVDQMIREAELDEVRQELQDATSFDIAGDLHNAIDPDGSLGQSLSAPNYPDYFVEAEGPAPLPQRALPPPDAVIAPQAPLRPGMPEPQFVGFEGEEEPKFIGFDDEPPLPHDDATAISTPPARAAEPAKP